MIVQNALIDYTHHRFDGLRQNMDLLRQEYSRIPSVHPRLFGPWWLAGYKPPWWERLLFWRY